MLCQCFGIDYTFCQKDGERVAYGDTILKLSGGQKELLQIERGMLNILQHASGIATQTNAFVQQLNNPNIKLLDTRKTRPLLRDLEKYAVVCGGGYNHRMGLDDCLMLKDTHLKGIDDLALFVKKAREKIPFTCQIEIECESLEGVQEALHAKADIIMCDNMSIDEIQKALDLRDEIAPLVLVEASGNISLDNIGDYASLNIDAISTGSLIHQAQWVDFSMKMQ